MTSTYKYIKHFHVQHFDVEYKYIKQKYFRHLYVEHLLPEYNAPVLEIHNDGSGTQTDPSTWSAEDLSQLQATWLSLPLSWHALLGAAREHRERSGRMTMMTSER